MVDTLLSLFPDPDDLLSLDAEELAGVVLELAPAVMQNGLFNIQGLFAQVSQPFGPSYPEGTREAVMLALAGAVSWLVTGGLMVEDPRQQNRAWYVFTRRGKTLRVRTDVEAYRKGRVLPVELLQPSLAKKVRPQFLRGDHDVAVFQAFREVEVAVRVAANKKGAGYADDVVGVQLMRKAFHPESGPLTDANRVPAEREADMHLFSGAIGHAKNPPGHRDVNLPPQEAARLVIFASHLLDIVALRSM
jgi:hypothetical protein